MNICTEVCSEQMLSYTKIAILFYNTNLTGSRWRNFQCVTMMMIFTNDTNIFSILPYINWYLHEYNATKSTAEIFILSICNQIKTCLVNLN